VTYIWPTDVKKIITGGPQLLDIPLLYNPHFRIL